MSRMFSVLFMQATILHLNIEDRTDVEIREKQRLNCKGGC